MTSRRERLLLAARTIMGAIWLVAAVAKLRHVQSAYELTSRAVPAWLPPRQTLAFVIAGETVLGASMLMGVVRGLLPSLLGLLALSGGLLVVRAEVGPNAFCGCFGTLVGSTVDDALVRNVAFVAVHVPLIVYFRRRRDAAAPAGAVP